MVLLVLLVVVTQAQSFKFIRFAGSDTVYKAYQTAAEFFRDGGAEDFSNVQVISQEPLLGSVNLANEYHATTTQQIAPITPAYFTLKSETGALGSVIITGAATGNFTLYDATTTDVTKRAGATSTLTVLAHFPTSAAAGTYTFDEVFFKGLLYTSVGNMGSSTITYR